MKNILIVDDSPTPRQLLRELLQAQDYTTAEVEDGIEALSALEREPFDVIVCDVLMPNMDGYSLCREVRRRPEFKNLFFVLYTATDFTPNDEKLGLALGADKFISKMSHPTTILETIVEVIGKRRESRSEHLTLKVNLPFEKEMKKYDPLMIRQLEENSVGLGQARDELRSLNQELERRVGERTKELAAKNTALELRTEELARSNADLVQFAYAASHDLQEPVRAVAGCIQIFKRKYQGKLDQKGDELIGMIVDGSARMKALIDGLLAYSRAGQDEKLDTIDTGLVLQEVLEDLSAAISESKANFVLGKLPPLCFAKKHFRQVLQNLVDNAIKYRSEADLTIHVRAVRQASAWIFSIADNGIGFEQQYAEQVFGVFQRLHTRERYLGTGIGLAVGKKIVERRGGRIWAESSPNHGSTFFFSIPDKHVALEN